MDAKSQWLADYQENIEALLEDIILLEAMELRLTQNRPHMVNVPTELLDQTRQRVLDYLAQHTTALCILTRT